ncbi:MAG: HlyC/CorC family transporter [Eggerthellaceae bacterium]|nr:HlyC/CorC family transporter [Eggerthellaceae bacterium]
MDIAISLVLVVAFLLMNAFFVVAEFSLVRVRKSQIEIAIDEGKKGAKNAKTITDNINAYLSACQLGITLASLALGFLGEPAFSALIHPVLSMMGLSDALISAIAIAFGYIVMTTLHVVIGELIPKSFAIFSTEKYALFSATPLLIFYKVTYPIMWIFNGITNFVVRLFGHDPANEHEIYTGDEIKLLIDESTEGGLIDEDANEIVDNVFDMGEKDACAIMTPRIDMVCLDTEDSLEENLDIIRQYKYTRYPVCRGSKDYIVGFVHIKDLYDLGPNAPMEQWPIRDIPAVPETAPMMKVLEVMQDHRTEITAVVDEHGGTAGFVTMSDIMEQIVGRIDDEYMHEADNEVVTLADGSLLIDGSLPVGEIEDLIGFEPEEVEECETAGGLLLALFDRIPKAGDMVTADHPKATAVFTVMDMDRHRIDKIRIEVIHKEAAGE